MKKIIISGINGRMGKMLTDIISEREDMQIVAGIDKATNTGLSIPVFSSPEEINIKADCVIDFSNPALLDGLLNYCIENKVSLVLSTTGYDLDALDTIMKASKLIPIFFSANMSLGINLIIELAKKASSVLGYDFDVEIIEKHHNQKLDSPSGTALMIADGINSVSENKYNYAYNRPAVREKRGQNEIGIHPVRGGTIVGDHEVIFAGQDEVITISHSATSRKVFANGAVNAAIFLIDQQPGMYNMGDLIK